MFQNNRTSFHHTSRTILGDAVIREGAFTIIASYILIEKKPRRFTNNGYMFLAPCQAVAKL